MSKGDRITPRALYKYDCRKCGRRVVLGDGKPPEGWERRAIPQPMQPRDSYYTSGWFCERCARFFAKRSGLA